LWAPTDTQSVWTAVSRAVRVPSRDEHDQYDIDSVGENEAGDVEYAMLVGSPAFKPEKLTAYEVGYRVMPAKHLSFDVASFYNVYDDLQTTETEDSFLTATPFPGTMTPLVRANNARGRVAGAEATVYWTVNDMLQLSGNYTRLHMDLHAKPESNDEDAEAFETKNARNQFYGRVYVDLPYKVDLSAELRYVGAIAGEEIPGYVDGNFHLSRVIRGGLRLNLSLDNVMHSRHAEWDLGGLVQSRAFRAGVTWSF